MITDRAKVTYGGRLMIDLQCSSGDVKIFVFEKIIEHLYYNRVHETRKREKLRTEIAIRTINKWITMGEEEHDKRENRIERNSVKDRKKRSKVNA